MGIPANNMSYYGAAPGHDHALIGAYGVYEEHVKNNIHATIEVLKAAQKIAHASSQDETIQHRAQVSWQDLQDLRSALESAGMLYAHL